MSRLRQPLFWIVLAEVVLMFVLFAVAWRVYEAHRPAASAGFPLPPSSASPPAAAPTQRPSPPPSRPSPTPGVAGRKPALFPVDLAALNRDQASLERAEDAVLVELIRSARGYLETVVLPAVRRVERVSAAISPATAQSPAATRKML